MSRKEQRIMKLIIVYRIGQVLKVPYILLCPYVMPNFSSTLFKMKSVIDEHVMK
jgi:hypothetical protein